MLNDQCSSWSSVLAGIPQGSILGPLLFLIYINDLPENLQSTVKLFADDTSLFSTVYEPNISATQLERDRKITSHLAYKWKMNFNPELSKQAQEVIFFRKTVKVCHPSIAFNIAPVARTACQKHLGWYVDEKLNFHGHINSKILKANKGIGIIKSLSNTLPRKSLLTIYKSFIRPYLDYCDIIYDQPNNKRFCIDIKHIQYNAALAITGAIKGTSQTKLYKKLGSESLKIKIKTSGKPEYLFNLLPTGQHTYDTQNLDQTETYYCRTDAFKFFFLYARVEWNKLDLGVRKSKSYAIVWSALLKIDLPNQCSIYRIHNPVGLKLLTRLTFGLSHLNEHRFNHNFQSSIDPLCSCSLAIESTTHFLLHCHHFSNIRSTLLNSINEFLGSITNISDRSGCALAKILLFGDQNYTEVENASIINATIKYLVDSERFNGPLL